jgi:hypothetical protein
MANRRASAPDIQGALPQFEGVVNPRAGSTDYTGGQALDKAAGVFSGLSDRLFSMADEAAKVEGKVEGSRDAMQQDWRPTNDFSTRAKAYDAAGTQTYLNNLNSKLREGTDDIYSKWGQLPADQRNPEALATSLDGMRDRMLKGPDGDGKQADVFPEIEGHFNDRFSTIKTAYMRAARDDLEKRQMDAAKASTSTAVVALNNQASRLAALPGAGDEALDQTQRDHDALIDHAVKTELITAQAGEKVKRGFQQQVLTDRTLAVFKAMPAADQIKYAKAFEADYAAKDPKVTKGFDADTYERVLGTMQSQVRVNGNALKSANKEAYADINAAQKQIVSGDDITPEKWLDIRSRYGASTDPDVAASFQTLERTRTMFARFKGMRPEAIETEIANAEARIAAKGVTPEQKEVLDAARTYVKTYQSDLANNQLRRAAREGVIGEGGNMVELSVSDPGIFQAGLVKRAAQVARSDEYFGQKGNFLTPGEKSLFKSVAAQGGPRMIQVSGDIAHALGKDAGRVFSEIGGDAPDFAHVGYLQMLTADPEGLRDFAERKRLNNIEKESKMLNDTARKPNAQMAQSKFDGVYGDAFSAMPQFNEQARATARAMWEAQGLRRNFDPTLSSDSGRALVRDAQIAAGASFNGDTQYGGVGSFKNGWISSQKVAVPPGMKAEAFTQVIGAIKDEDLKAAGAQNVNARQLRGAVLTSIGHGQYRVSLGDPNGKDPQWVVGQSGAPFTLDLEAMGDTLRQRVPGAYRSR